MPTLTAPLDSALGATVASRLQNLAQTLPDEPASDSQTAQTQEQPAQKPDEKPAEKPAEDTQAPKSEPEEPKETPEEPKETNTDVEFPDLTPVADKPEGGKGSDATIKSWQKMKATLAERDTRLATLTKELETFRANAAEQESTSVDVEKYREEIEVLRTKLQDAERNIKAADYTRSSEYAEDVRKPMESITKTVNELAKEYDIDSSALLRAIAEPDRRTRSTKLDDLTEGMASLDKADIIDAAHQYHRVQQHKARIEADAEQVWQEQQKVNEQKRKELFEQDLRTTVAAANDTMDVLSKDYEFLRPIEGEKYAAWNQRLESTRKAIADVNLDAMESGERGKIVARAALLPFFEQAVKHYKTRLTEDRQTLGEKIKQLEQEADRLRGTRPQISGGTDTADPKDDKPSKFQNPGEAIAERLSKILQ